VARRLAGDVVPTKSDFAARGRPQPGDDLGQRALAIARHAGQADDLAGAHVEADPAQRRPFAVVLCLHVAQAEAHLVGSAGLLGRLGGQRPANHHLGQLLLGRALHRRRADGAAVAQHRHPVAQLDDLVQLVGDEDQRVAVALHLLQRQEELVHFLRRQHGRRLVEDKQRRAAIEGLDDLHPLLLADGELPDHRVGVNVQAVELGQLLDARRHPVEVGARPARRLHPQGDVLPHRQRRHQHEVLVDHADAVANGVGRRLDGDDLTIQPNLTLVRLIEAVENFHQRALARAVLAQQSVDFAGAHVKINPVAGQHTGEALGDAAHLHVVNARMAGGEEVGRHSQYPVSSRSVAQ